MHLGDLVDGWVDSLSNCALLLEDVARWPCWCLCCHPADQLQARRHPSRISTAWLLMLVASCMCCRKNPKDRRQKALADVLGAFDQLGRPVYHMIGNHWCGNRLLGKPLPCTVYNPNDAPSIVSSSRLSYCENNPAPPSCSLYNFTRAELNDRLDIGRPDGSSFYSFRCNCIWLIGSVPT